MSDSGSGLDFLEADFGEQNAAGGAYHLNNNTKPEYWDKWVQQGTRSPIWPFFFFLLCSVALAALPMIVEVFATAPQSQSATADQQSLPDHGSAASDQLGPCQYQMSSAPDQYQQASLPDQYQTAPQQQLEPQSTYASGTYASTPGYDSRFGKPVR
jgi:hypothetical protein